MNECIKNDAKLSTQEAEEEDEEAKIWSIRTFPIALNAPFNNSGLANDNLKMGSILMSFCI